MQHPFHPSRIQHTSCNFLGEKTQSNPPQKDGSGSSGCRGAPPVRQSSVWQTWCVTKMCVTRLSVTEFCVKDVTCGEWCVWQRSVWQMICDAVVSGKLVSARWCVAKVVGGTVCVCRCCVSVWNMLCDTDGVWQSFMWWSSVWKMACQTCMWQSCVKKMWKSVCDRWCVCDRWLCGKNSVWQGFHVTKLCVMDGLCFKLQVTKPCVKDGRWQSGVWVMAPDNLVCARLCVIKFLKNIVLHSSGWQMSCDEVMCDRCCVMKWCLAKMWQSCVWEVVWDSVVCDDKVVGSKQSETTSHCFERRRKSETHLCQTLQPWKMNKN